jgi:hypothetical protein
MIEMVSISYGTFAALLTIIVAIGPGFYWVGRLSKQVDTNTTEIASVKEQIAEIFRFVRNGRS